MRRKFLLSVTLIIGLFIIGFIYINVNYLFTPFNYPKGNISEFDYSYKTFKKPIRVEMEKWEGTTNKEYLITDELVVENLLEHFDNAQKLTNIQPYSFLPSDELGASYKVRFRQGETGRILIQIRFLEKNNLFDIAGVDFYELNDSFKSEIFSSISKHGK